MGINEIKDIYGRIMKQPRMYQGGGTVGRTQYDLSNMQNPLAQQMLTSLQGYGMDFDPSKIMSGQMPSMDFSSQNIADIFRSKYGIGSKVEMPYSMFQELTPEMFKGTESATYDPLRDVTYAGLEDKALEQQSQINTGGFYSSGAAETKRKDIRTDVAEGVTKGEMDIDKLISGSFGDILGQMQGWEAQAQKLRYG